MAYHVLPNSRRFANRAGDPSAVYLYVFLADFPFRSIVEAEALAGYLEKEEGGEGRGGERGGGEGRVEWRGGEGQGEGEGMSLFLCQAQRATCTPTTRILGACDGSSTDPRRQECCGLDGICGVSAS